MTMFTVVKSSGGSMLGKILQSVKLSFLQNDNSESLGVKSSQYFI